MGAVIAGALLLSCWLGSICIGKTIAHHTRAPRWVARCVAQLVGGGAVLALVLLAAASSISLSIIAVGLLVAMLHASIIAHLMRG